MADLVAWQVIDFFDSPEVLDASVTAIPGSAGTHLQVVASLAHSCHRIFVRDGIKDRFIGVYVGAPGSETLATIIGVEAITNKDLYIEKGSRISLRAMDAGDISQYSLCIQFMSMGAAFSRLGDPGPR